MVRTLLFCSSFPLVQFAGLLPKDRILGSIRLNEVANALNAKLIYGKESFNTDIEVRGVFCLAHVMLQYMQQ